MTQGASPCPPDDTFARLIDGRLDPAATRELDAHSDTCPACAHALAELARTLAPDRGDWLGQRYRLLEPLGAGGMGVVYVAFDVKLQRKVAIKRLRESGAGAAAERRRNRFLREAQLLASLSHPNVVTVHDVGEIDREVYVVLELVDGWPMSRWISEAPSRPGWRQIVDVYLQVGRGLSAAHRLGVVHRDVKPDNILVARNGRAQIGDFGLAGLAAAASVPIEGTTSPLVLTQSGTVLGTPAYMAPEQHEGELVDAAADQFSFCVSLYESLHGRRPFAGATATEILAAMRRGLPAPGAHGVPGPVHRALATGLQQNPNERFVSMDALLEALTKARDRKPRRLLELGVAVGIGAFVLGAVMLRGQRPETRGPSPAAVFATSAPTVAAPSPAPAALLAASSHDVKGDAPRTSPKGGGPRPHRHAGGNVIAARGMGTGPSAPPRLPSDPETDPQLLLYRADRAYAERDGAACLAALERVHGTAWPADLTESARRRRGLCEMLRGNCDGGFRLLEALDGTRGARASQLGHCPVGSFATFEDRVLAVATQADAVRYGSNQPQRRQGLRDILMRETETAPIQTCFRDPHASRGCGRRLTILAQAYQALAEAYLIGRACREGAALDVMQSEVKFATMEPGGGDPALRCRAKRVFDAYHACSADGDEAERRCLARVRGGSSNGATPGGPNPAP